MNYAYSKLGKGIKMLIRCPKCQVCYRIEERIITEKGKKFRCAKCNEVWMAYPQDLFEETLENASEIYTPGQTKENTSASEADNKSKGQETQENVEQEDKEEATQREETQPEITEKDLNNAVSMQEIFSRIEKQNAELAEQDKKKPLFKKIKDDITQALGLNSTFNCIFFSAIIILIAGLAFFSFRYELVRQFPWLEQVYTGFGLDSVVLGEGLEFQNVSRHEYEEDYVKKMQIKGFIVNGTDKMIKVPQIHVEVLSKDIIKLNEMDVKSPIDTLRPKERTAFTVVITQPSSLSKHIVLTFSKSEE